MVSVPHVSVTDKLKRCSGSDHHPSEAGEEILDTSPGLETEILHQDEHELWSYPVGKRPFGRRPWGPGRGWSNLRLAAGPCRAMQGTGSSMRRRENPAHANNILGNGTAMF